MTMTSNKLYMNIYLIFKSRSDRKKTFILIEEKVDKINKNNSTTDIDLVTNCNFNSVYHLSFPVCREKKPGLRMGCGSSSASRLCADQELEAAVASFPAQEVEGEDERLGMGPPADKQFSNIRQSSPLS